MAATHETRTDTAPPRFQPEDLLQQAQVQDIALSPDGATIIYSRRVIEDGKYRTNLWLVPWNGGDARQLTSAAANDRHPVISPAGRTLAFISDRGGRQQPWLLPLDGGEARLARGCSGSRRGPSVPRQCRDGPTTHLPRGAPAAQAWLR